MDPSPSTSPPGAPPPAVLPGPPAPGSSPVLPVGSAAAKSAPLFGGSVGRKVRKDGLRSGTPEALAADREKDRLRKARLRASAIGLTPPAALPTAAPSSPRPPVAPGPVPPGYPPPPPPLGAMPGFAPLEAPPLPWQANMLRPLLEQLIPALEASDVAKLKGELAELRLPPPLLKQIADDAAWPVASKKALEVSAPEVGAKWLNKAGISAENQHEVMLGGALVGIVVSRRLLRGRIEKLIAEVKKQREERAAEAARAGAAAQVNALSGAPPPPAAAP